MKICFIFSNRAEFSLLEPFIIYFKKKSVVDILDISKEIKNIDLDKNLYKIHKLCFEKFSQNNYDFVCVLGDRRELPFITLPAFFLKINIVHIGAGEYLIGLPTYDQFIRPVISILSNYQICFSTKAKNEVKKMFSGLSNLKSNVHSFGNPVFANQDINKMKKPIKGIYNLVLLHPQSLNRDKTKEDIKYLKKELGESKTIFISGNKDRNYDLIKKFYKSISNNKNYVFHENLPKKKYLSYVKYCNKFYTNSSSISEIEFLNKKSLVQIGERNIGRVKHKMNNNAPQELYMLLKKKN